MPASCLKFRLFAAFVALVAATFEEPSIGGAELPFPPFPPLPPVKNPFVKKKPSKPPHAAERWRVINCLETIDPNRDTINGAWTFDGSTLLSGGDRPSRVLTLPYAPPEAYTLMAVVQRRDGTGGLGLGLVVGSNACVIRIDDEGVSGIPIDEKAFSRNETTYKGDLLKKGKPHTIVCTVRKAGKAGNVPITVQVDGREVIDWKSKPDRLRIGGKLEHPIVKAGRQRCLWLQAFDSVFAITKLELTPIGGGSFVWNPASNKKSSQVVVSPVPPGPPEPAPRTTEEPKPSPAPVPEPKMEPGPKPPTKNEESPPTPEPKAEPMPPAKTEEPGQEQATQTVVAEGVGTDEDKALKDAFRNAVRQAVGAVVDAETLVKNDDVIKDQVLTYSDGFITKYDVKSTKKEDGLVRTTIQATVERRKLIQKLQAANVTVKKMEGQSLFGEAVTQQDAKANATQLLKKALEGLPTMLTAEMVGKPTYDADKGEAVLQISITPDRKAFDAFRERLEQVLDKIALRKESVLRTNSVTGGSNTPKRRTLGTLYAEDDDEGRICRSPLKPDEKKAWWIWVNYSSNADYTTTKWNGYVMDADPVESVRYLLGETRLNTSLLDSVGAVVTEDDVVLRSRPSGVGTVYMKALRDFLVVNLLSDLPTYRDYQRALTRNTETVAVYIAPLWLGVSYAGISYSSQYHIERRIKLSLDELKRVTDVRCKVTFRPDADK